MTSNDFLNRQSAIRRWVGFAVENRQRWACSLSGNGFAEANTGAGNTVARNASFPYACKHLRASRSLGTAFAHLGKRWLGTQLDSVLRKSKNRWPSEAV